MKLHVFLTDGHRTPTIVTFGTKLLNTNPQVLVIYMVQKIFMIIATWRFLVITYIKVTFMDKIQDKYQSLTTCSLLENGAIPYQLQRQRERAAHLNTEWEGLDI